MGEAKFFYLLNLKPSGKYVSLKLRFSHPNPELVPITCGPSWPVTTVHLPPTSLQRPQALSCITKRPSRWRSKSPTSFSAAIGVARPPRSAPSKHDPSPPTENTPCLETFPSFLHQRRKSLSSVTQSLANTVTTKTLTSAPLRNLTTHPALLPVHGRLKRSLFPSLRRKSLSQ